MVGSIIPVVAACIVSHGKVLLRPKLEAKDEQGIPRNPEMVGLWEFPGGMMNYGETPEKALEREIYEELRINILIRELVHARSALYDHHYLVLYYLCNTTNAVPPDCKWVYPKGIPSMTCLPGTAEVAKILERYNF